MTTASFPTALIAEHWRAARAWLAEAMREFRGPAAIAVTLVAQARAVIRARLVRIELFVMKLLLMEVANRWTEPPACGPRTCAMTKTPPARSAGPARRTLAFRPEDPADPQTWRVRFRLRIPRPRRRARGFGGLDIGDPKSEGARAEAHARRLARRFEALRRVLADPRRAVASLARTLRALGHAIDAVARRIALARPPRAKSLGPTFAAAIVYACDACACLNPDTS